MNTNTICEKVETIEFADKSTGEMKKATVLRLKQDLYFQRSSGKLTGGTKRTSLIVEWPEEEVKHLENTEVPFNIVKQECSRYEYPVGSGNYHTHTWVAELIAQ